MDPTFLEWFGLLVRWFHVIAGILWIGSSMFFQWLDARLERLREPRPGFEGQAWMVHGGGFYNFEKLHLQPHEIPERLHWSWLEATSTWVSGMVLLAVVYYLGGGGLLIDPAVRPLGVPTAAAVTGGLLAASWFVYDGIWRSPLARRPAVASAVSLALAVGLAHGLTRLFSARAAYIHVGAVLGTLMAANVWAHILPAQRQMLAATRAGRHADPAMATRARTRSRHNHYMTYPVIFIMISSHYPLTWGSPFGWAVLAVLGLGSAGVKYLMNQRTRGAVWIPAAVALAVATIAGGAWVASIRPPAGTRGAAAAASLSPVEDVPFARAESIVRARCVPCHAPRPTQAGYAAPPNGIVLDTPSAIRAQAERIRVRAVEGRTMPLANLTGMTDDERALLGAWIAAGARGPRSP